MNRRNFFKFLGIGAATAVIAPKIISESHTVTSPMIRCHGGHVRIKSIFPESVQISEEQYQWLEYLRKKMDEQLGVNDLHSLQKAKINV
jgi:hypothetical protein